MKYEMTAHARSSTPGEANNINLLIRKQVNSAPDKFDYHWSK